MAGSESFIGYLGGDDWTSALETLRDTYGRGLARWLGDHLGVSPRQVQRYMAAAGITSGAQQRTPTPSRQQVIMRLAAAAKLRTCRGFDLGDVDVQYDETDQGVRNVRSFNEAPNFEGAARALEAGDVAMAAELFDQEAMRVYGAENLDVTDYHNPGDIRLW